MRVPCAGRRSDAINDVRNHKFWVQCDVKWTLDREKCITSSITSKIPQWLSNTHTHINILAIIHVIGIHRGDLSSRLSMRFPWLVRNGNLIGHSSGGWSRRRSTANFIETAIQIYPIKVCSSMDIDFPPSLNRDCTSDSGTPSTLNECVSPARSSLSHELNQFSAKKSLSVHEDGFFKGKSKNQDQGGRSHFSNKNSIFKGKS